ncbi:exo-beta-N-acetylmuramidase NamZ domain-containing protein [Cupriavidus sp. WS]|uniref:exo-beta-N-acetylmuramidase NamZ domain-containing protein n=1 Tax=Cupriavidus sp. WS TaxID=1312922 RepID=UPI000382B3E3|nr:exo-beta-N-acetylmuramidase NamZ domain-containing protein [Cupriavidus sp. WS]
MSRRALSAMLSTALLACALAAAGPAAAQSAPAAAAREQLRAIVEGQIAAGNIPGAVVLAGDASHIRYQLAAGRRAVLPASEAMRADTVFDLASVTKVIATTTAVLQLSERAAVALDAPVARYLPAFGAAGKQAITVRQLLAHTSGLPAGLPPRQRAHGGDAAREAVRQALALAPVAPPGERVIYSDVNFVVLGELVRRVAGQPLDAWCRDHVFAPLGMRDTGFLPGPAAMARTAPTAPRGGRMLRGQVHDPTAARLGGVAGNAGLFSTAADLARFAQMILNGGQAGGTRVLRPESIALLASPATPVAAGAWRGLGWALAAPLAANRDRLPPLGLLEQTGYTGTGVWIDMVGGRFAVILSSRLHPADKGNAAPLRQQVLALLASEAPPLAAQAIGSAVPGAAAALAHAMRLPPAAGPVRSGIDVLEAQAFAPLAGLRVGLVTNRSGFDGRGVRTADVLARAPGVTLAALFAPEHGLGSDVDAPLGDALDARTGVPVHSLYGEQRRFAPATLAGVDALVFDVQDAGVRFFTYITTLGYMLEAAAARGIPAFVLDRPDPLGADRFGGPLPDPGPASFTGYFPLPLLHGMTVGELARLFNSRLGIGADLRVIAMQGYTRGMRFADTGLGWVPLSPNLRDAAQLDLYPDVGLIEGANVSVGRGTPAPFTLVGAPWIAAPELAAYLNALDAGARFEPVSFVPTEGRYRGRLCQGVSIRPGPAPRPPSRLGLALAIALHALHEREFDLPAIRASLGSGEALRLIAAHAPLAEVEQAVAAQGAGFAAVRAPFLIY